MLYAELNTNCFEAQRQSRAELDLELSYNCERLLKMNKVPLLYRQQLSYLRITKIIFNHRELQDFSRRLS